MARRLAQRPRGRGDLYFAELECFVDLDPSQAGVHMSRFEEVVNEAIDAVVLGEALRAEELAAHIAEHGPRAPGAACAPRSRSPPAIPRPSPRPSSKIPTQEIYTLLGTAVASDARARARSPASRPRG